MGDEAAEGLTSLFSSCFFPLFLFVCLFFTLSVLPTTTALAAAALVRKEGMRESEKNTDTERPKIFLRECYDPLHIVLPLGYTKPAGAFTPSKTLCISCLVKQFNQLPPNAAVRALQDTILLLQQSFAPLMGKQTLGFLPAEHFSWNYSAQCDPSMSPWHLLLSFHDVMKQLAEKLCGYNSLHHHVQLYKTGLALLSLLFTILKENMIPAPLSCDTPFPVYGDRLGTEESNETAIAESMRMAVFGLARCICEAVHATLLEEGESPAGLLFMTDLADMSPTFLQAAAENCLPLVCNFVSLLKDVYRVELVLYLLHQVFETCAEHPLWLESLAETISRNACAVGGTFLLDFLAWALGTFRDEEPVVVNALCLSRFLMTYETTRTAVLQVRIDESGSLSSDILLKLQRNLILLLLHLNGDVVITAAETLRELVIATHSFREFPDMADYVIESLRTASVDSAASLVLLLNALPPEIVPAGPTLRVIFELATVSKKAFEDAIKGPHFLASVTDRFTNVNEVAQQIVRTVQHVEAISLHCFLLQLLCLETACGGENKGVSVILPEIASTMANSLLHLLEESCGGIPTEGEANTHEELFRNRLGLLPDETLKALFRGVAFLLPSCQMALLRVVAELLWEALRQFLVWDAVPVDGRFVVDNNTSDTLLILGSTVLEHSIDNEEGKNITDDFFWRQTRYLLQNNLLGLLLGIQGGSVKLRVRIMHHFIRLAEPNRGDDICVDADSFDRFLFDDSTSPKVLLRKSFCHHPYWAASFLLALATGGCPQPVEADELEEFLFEQMSGLSWFSNGSRQVLVPCASRNRDKDNDAGDEGCAIVVLTVLKTCAAYHRWMGDLPRREVIHLNSYCKVGIHFVVPQNLWFSFFLLFRFADSSWINAMGSHDWGTVLLAILVSSAVLHIRVDAPTERAETAYNYFFSGDTESQQTGEPQAASLCRLVVRHATRCGLFLSQLFEGVRRLAEVISCRVISFLCQCVFVSVGEGLSVSVEFIRLLLEQHVTPVLLYREEPVLSKDVGRLVVLALAHLPISVASCCDHTLFRWAMQHVLQPNMQVYAWQIVFFLLERTHGGEFALRHELELEAKLRLESLEEIPFCIEAVLATVRWMVAGAMRRRGVRRLRPIVKAPLREWAGGSSGDFVLRAFIISAVERHTRDVFPDAELVEAAPMLLAWSAEMFARQCATVAAARLVYALVKASLPLSASLEALGLFLQLTDTGATTPSTAAPYAGLGIVERAWVFAALLSSWPPWGAAGGLKMAVDAFLSTLETPKGSSGGVKRSRVHGMNAIASPSPTEGAGACGAMRALVDACERQSERCGTFSLNRARDFFLRSDVLATADVDEAFELVFASPREGCGLFFLR